MDRIDQVLRQSYSVMCSCCGRAEVVIAIVENEIWSKIVKNDEYSLCPICMDARIGEAGLVDVKFYLHFLGDKRGLVSAPPEWARKIMLRMEPRGAHVRAEPQADA